MSIPSSPLWTRELSRPLLVVRFAAPLCVLSWAVHNGGRRQAAEVAWLEVRNADLPPEVDPAALLGDRLRACGLGDAVGLLTSRRIDRFHEAEIDVDGIAARALATVGLSNALRVGDPPGAGARVGTINVLCAVAAPLTEAAALEALALAAEARTAAVLEAGFPSRRSGRPATGTGTDCLVLAWTPGARTPYAGKHTAVGAAVGGAVERAVRDGVTTWLAEQTTAELEVATC